MAKSKALISHTTIDMTKPLVKEHIDAKESLNRFIETMLPHQPHSKIRIIFLYTVDNISKYRVNWFEEYTDGVVSKIKITASRYIQVENTEKGLKVTDTTID